ncbi:4a-hydroxytetrahydrobiopterin dehydratase [Paenibacillus glufosinatiresistens]|uniref:4a-hydroxytetrahydrobiopterin dehydratase n=1 Tax=Paenibacillus glufosinatiresistens TaxID=3070657 RepID=UPI00286DF3B1|nr:4a-hydroxytetrahydrobiopterin dehydratase [Paenibacillus sp. YX.27]
MLYTDGELDEQLRQLEGWKREEHVLIRKYTFEEFMKGIAFVDEVAAISEAFGRHPHITIDYRNVTLHLATDRENGITAQDIRQAHEFNEAFDKTR